MTLTVEILSQMPGNPLEGLRRVDALWQSLREGTQPIPTVIQANRDTIDLEWDVVICGGTLGVLLGAALAQRGWQVALLERGMLRGRDQEWNISRQELQVFVELALLTEAELEQTIATAFNPSRIAFRGSPPVQVRDVLNIGVDPVTLLETLKQKFLAHGGRLFEQTPFEGAIVHANGVTVNAGQQTFQTRLVLDAMGHFSPIVQQARQGKKPDAVCLVVGTCAEGIHPNASGDLIATITPIQNQCQYFWEAFPARDGRTTYLFTYLDAHPDRPSLEAMFDDYFRLLPDYQQVSLEQLQFKRALFGFFPCYRQSPLKPAWNYILPIGDSSGSQSPLSFGGFGAMIRHLPRLTNGIHAALESDTLKQGALSLLHPYQPNLAVTWLFQRSMSVGINQTIDPNQINELLAIVFQAMETLGDPVLKPFLQDVVQFSALFQTLAQTTLMQPTIVFKIIPQVGLLTLFNWLFHYTALAAYAALYPLARSLEPSFKNLPVVPRYYCDRWLQALEYGSGGDHITVPTR